MDMRKKIKMWFFIIEFSWFGWIDLNKIMKRIQLQLIQKFNLISIGLYLFEFTNLYSIQSNSNTKNNNHVESK
jgi:hypothetical protein